MRVSVLCFIHELCAIMSWQVRYNIITSSGLHTHHHQPSRVAAAPMPLIIGRFRHPYWALRQLKYLYAFTGAARHTKPRPLSIERWCRVLIPQSRGERISPSWRLTWRDADFAPTSSHKGLHKVLRPRGPRRHCAVEVVPHSRQRGGFPMMEPQCQRWCGGRVLQLEPETR